MLLVLVMEERHYSKFLFHFWPLFRWSFYETLVCHGIFLSLEKGVGFQGPSKEAFFVWHALNGKILTVNLIKKKQVHINWCCMSKKDRYC